MKALVDNDTIIINYHKGNDKLYFDNKDSVTIDSISDRLQTLHCTFRYEIRRDFGADLHFVDLHQRRIQWRHDRELELVELDRDRRAVHTRREILPDW